MGATLILWSHALAALLFGALALSQRRRGGAGLPQRAFVVALVLTALWALAVAGIDPRDVAARVGQSARDIAWLGFMFVVVRRDRAGGYALASVYLAVGMLPAIAAALAVAEAMPLPAAAVHAIGTARVLFRAMAGVGALLLVHHLYASVASPARGAIRPVLVALAVMWGGDVLLLAIGSAGGAWPIGARGLVMAGAAALLAVGAHRSDGWTPTVSRAVAVRSLSMLGVSLYAGTVALLTHLAASLAGPHARIAQTGIVFGATAALLALLSTPWLRAWVKVKVAKHFFRHRYDYRTEWQRFTDTLGKPGEGAAPLDVRIVKAVADLTDSPAGLLLVPDGTGLGAGAGWKWEGAPPSGMAGEAALAERLSAASRIIELDAVRGGHGDAAVVPGWLKERADAWAIVPLVHVGSLVGAILLARPPVDRALDWEDFDLLRIAGRQAASYLAEDRAHAALADARRFDEFNRRFAFILHDIKNLVSQITLVARNAERHADNPDFRADMVMTLKDSADRMNALLARLSQHHGSRAEAVQPVDTAALLARVAAGRRAQHPVVVHADGAPLAMADPARMEQVIGHLVQNAIEASDAAAPVLLSAGGTGDGVAIEVIDRGCGMAPGFVRDQLFRPFVSTKPGGFGIGAFEARQLVQAMGGTLAVDSREGEGTRFRIVLPVAMGMEAAA